MIGGCSLESEHFSCTTFSFGIGRYKMGIHWEYTNSMSDCWVTGPVGNQKWRDGIVWNINKGVGASKT